MNRYAYVATRTSDGTEIHRNEICDVDEKGLGAMANIVRAALIHSHPLAKGLTFEDIDVTMRILNA